MSGKAQALHPVLAASNAATAVPREASSPILELRVVRGPLDPSQDETIVRKYNELTSSKIPVGEFRHWVQGGPEGSAYHALLETEERQIAGHICLIPFQTRWRGQAMVVAKAEYFFVEERYRGGRVRGFENTFKPPAILLL